MKKFETLTSQVVPLPIENIDTDQIIPARFLKATTREGFGDNLFRDWRFDTDNQPKTDFVLNNPTYTVKTLVVVQAASMPLGLFKTMVLMWSSAHSLPIYSKEMPLTTVYYRFRYLKSFWRKFSNWCTKIRQRRLLLILKNRQSC